MQHVMAAENVSPSCMAASCGSSREDYGLTCRKGADALSPELLSSPGLRMRLQLGFYVCRTFVTTPSSCSSQEATVSQPAETPRAHCHNDTSLLSQIPELLIRNCFVSIWHGPSKSDTNYSCQLPSESRRCMKSHPRTIHHGLQWDLGPVILRGY